MIASSAKERKRRARRKRSDRRRETKSPRHLWSVALMPIGRGTQPLPYLRAADSRCHTLSLSSTHTLSLSLASLRSDSCVSTLGLLCTTAGLTMLQRLSRVVLEGETVPRLLGWLHRLLHEDKAIGQVAHMHLSLSPFFAPARALSLSRSCTHCRPISLTL